MKPMWALALIVFSFALTQAWTAAIADEDLTGTGSVWGVIHSNNVGDITLDAAAGTGACKTRDERWHDAKFKGGTSCWRYADARECTADRACLRLCSILNGKVGPPCDDIKYIDVQSLDPARPVVNSDPEHEIPFATGLYHGVHIALYHGSSLGGCGLSGPVWHGAQTDMFGFRCWRFYNDKVQLCETSKKGVKLNACFALIPQGFFNRIRD
jgi:hypothetical protein